MELHVDPDVLRKSSGEQLCLLQRRQMPRVRQACLESVHVCINRGTERQAGKISKMVGGQRRSEALVAEQTKAGPGRPAGVSFQHIVPLLCGSRHVEGGEPNLVRLTCQLAAEGLTTVEPSERVFFAVVSGEGQLMEPGNALAVSMFLRLMARFMHHRSRRVDRPVHDGGQRRYR